MSAITQVAAWGATLLLGGFFVVIAWKVFTGEICLDWLFYGDSRSFGACSPSTFFSPGRAQMLAFSVIAAAFYLLQVIHDPTHFPDVPVSLLATLGGSHAVYLGGKAQALYIGRVRDIVSTSDRRNHD